MIRRPGKLRRGFILFGAAFSSMAALARGLWQHGQWALLPLALFLCATGLVLLFAFSVEALAPFIYAIF